MRQAFDDAEITGWEGLEGTYDLPDPDDEHIVAAAVVGGAGAIITLNIKDFPAALLPSGLETLRPAEFAANTVSLDPYRALNAIRAFAARCGTQGPPGSVDEIQKDADVVVVQHARDPAPRLRQPRPCCPRPARITPHLCEPAHSKVMNEM